MVIKLDLIRIYKALSNPTRIQILQWLKEPEKHFPDVYPEGVCVSDIQKKVELSQSTVSLYLSILQDAGFIQSTRQGQWTYYKRNEKQIEEIKQYMMDL